MAYGEVSTWDMKTGQGRIETDTGWYVVSAEDMEPRARAEKAKVDFDVAREQPFDRAINVRLREGTHANPKHRRYGDQSGRGQ